MLFGMALHARLADAQDVALNLVEQPVDLPLELIDPADHPRAGLDHLPQQMLVLDDYPGSS